MERLKTKLYENEEEEAYFYDFGKYQERHGKKTLGFLFNHDEEHSQFASKVRSFISYQNT